MVSGDGAAAGARRPERLLARRGGKVELLRVPALLFGVVAGLRGKLYDRGWLARERLDVPVVSVGNLTAGGTGKTPMVAWLVRELRRRGRRPGVLSRGYGAAPDDAERANDEARMLARLLPDVPRVQDPDRARGGRRLVRERGVDVCVLDDGFQHRRLARDLDLVLVDATRPWGLPAPADGGAPVRALLPRGLLRERPGALARADAIVLTRADLVDERTREGLSRELYELAPGRPILLAVHRAARLRGPGGESRPPGELAGRPVDLVSAIGNPEAFERTVAGLGARVDTHRSFPDHHDYVEADLRDLGRNGRWVVTTAKDAVKLEPLGAAVRVLEVELELVDGAGVMEALLDALPAGRVLRARASLHEGLHG